MNPLNSMLICTVLWSLLGAFVVNCSVLVLAGEIDPQQSKWHESYKEQPNAPNPASMLLNEDVEPELSKDFVPMFNGTDLKGWTPRGGKSLFEVVDGQVVGTCVKGSDSTYLCTDKSDYQNFIFTCEMKWLVDGNSGVMFRSRVKRNGKGKQASDFKEIVFGPQAEMEGFSKNRKWSGGIYGQSCGGYFYPLWLKEHATARTALKQGVWNRLTISASGDVVKTWINGVPIAHWIDDGTYPKGLFGLQIHKGREGSVAWRNVRIKVLP